MNKIFLTKNGCKTEISQEKCLEIYPNIKIDFNGINNSIELADDIKFHPSSSCHIFCKGNGNYLKIGSKCYFRRNVYVGFSSGGPGAVADNCFVSIGSGCNFNGANIAFHLGEANTKIVIGNDCLFAKNIILTTTDNHSIYDINTKARINCPGDIVIGNHVWFAQEVFVLNNTEVSDNSVLAARCVLTKRFNEPNIILGGVPAQIIRRNINWDIRLD